MTGDARAALAEVERRLREATAAAMNAESHSTRELAGLKRAREVVREVAAALPVPAAASEGELPSWCTCPDDCNCDGRLHQPGCAALTHDDEDSCSCGAYDEAATPANLGAHRWVNEAPVDGWNCADCGHPGPPVVQVSDALRTAAAEINKPDPLDEERGMAWVSGVSHAVHRLYAIADALDPRIVRDQGQGEGGGGE